MKFGIFGLGHFGRQLALDLAEEQHQVVGVDVDERIVEDLKDSIDLAVVADAADKKSLEQLSVDELDVAVVAIGENWSTSLMVTGHLQEIGVSRLICRAINPTHQKILNLMKVDEIVQAEEMAARQLAKRLKIRGAARHFALSEDYSIVELNVPKRLVGKTLEEAKLRSEYNLNLITVKRVYKSEENVDEEICKLVGVPELGTKFESRDRLILFGKDAHVEKFADKGEA